MADKEEIQSEFDASNRPRRELRASVAACVICGETIGCRRWFEDDPPPLRHHWQGEFRMSKCNLSFL